MAPCAREKRFRRAGIPWNLVLIFVIALMIQGVGCRKNTENERGAQVMPTEDVKRVMDAHVDELMAIPGVVGVAIGALKDGKPCIMVLVVKRTAELRERIPREIEGYPVRIDESGEIRAMPGDTAR